MILDDAPLEDPLDMGENGRTDIADITESLFPMLRDLQVAGIQALQWNGRQVGIKLNAAGGAFHFWVDADELHWGDEAALVRYDWLDGVVPSPSEAVQV